MWCRRAIYRNGISRRPSERAKRRDSAPCRRFRQALSANCYANDAPRVAELCEIVTQEPSTRYPASRPYLALITIYECLDRFLHHFSRQGVALLVYSSSRGFFARRKFLRFPRSLKRQLALSGQAENRRSRVYRPRERLVGH